MVSPDSLGTACPLSGRNSTYRLVQISETSSSVAKKLEIALGMKGARHQLAPAVSVQQVTEVK